MPISIYPRLAIMVRFTCWASLMGGLFMLLSHLPFILSDAWQKKNSKPPTIPSTALLDEAR